MTTKRNLLLVSLILVFGLAGSAPIAQAANIYAVVTANVYTVRYNSNADVVGSITLTFTSTGTVTGGQQLIVTLGWGAMTISSSDVVSFANAADIVGASGVSSAPIADFCVDTIGWCHTATASASGNVLTVLGSTSAINGVTPGNSITLYGLRINPIGNTPGGPIPYSTAIEAAVNQPINQQNFINMGGTTSTPGIFGPFEVAFVESEPGAFSQYPSIVCCVLVCKGIGTDVGYGGGSSQPTFTIEAVENWAGAFTALSDELALAPYAPDSSKTVTNGSDISITVSGIPVGVTVTPLAPAPCASNVGTLTFGPVTPSSFTGSTAPYGSVVTFDFPFATTTHTDIQCADYPFTVDSNGAVKPHSGPIWVSVQLDPAIGAYAEEVYYEGQTAPTGDYPSFTYPYSDAAGTWYQENALGSSEGFNVLQFADCNSYLMYPYVTNYNVPGAGPFSNWDTAIEYANTTSDPLQAGSAIPQNGACTAYFYDLGTTTFTSTMPVVEATPIVWISPPILSGGIYGYVLSQTAGHGQSGYIIAECNFTDAHGYAQTYDNYGGNPQVLSSYLAYTIPNPYLYSRAWAGEGYGEFAITPVDMDQLLHKIIRNIWKGVRVVTPPVP